MPVSLQELYHELFAIEFELIPEWIATVVQEVRSFVQSRPPEQGIVPQLLAPRGASLCAMSHIGSAQRRNASIALPHVGSMYQTRCVSGRRQLAPLEHLVVPRVVLDSSSLPTASRRVETVLVPHINVVRVFAVSLLFCAALLPRFLVFGRLGLRVRND